MNADPDAQLRAGPADSRRKRRETWRWQRRTRTLTSRASWNRWNERGSSRLRNEDARRWENGGQSLPAERDVVVATAALDRLGRKRKLVGLIRMALRADAVLVVGSAMADMRVLDADERGPRRKRTGGREGKHEQEHEGPEDARDPVLSRKSEHDGRIITVALRCHVGAPRARTIVLPVRNIVLRCGRSMTPVLLAGLVGVVQGARHAFEPDHVTAVATVMVEAPSPRRGIFYAACWGLGHAAMLLLVAGALVVLRVELPGLLTTILELCVGAMLVYLGFRTLGDAKKSALGHPVHDHTMPLSVRGRRPFAIGVMHGLAGSGALAALIAIGSPTIASGLGCLALYSFGTVVGMVALAAIAGPLLARAGRLPQIASSMARLAGVASIIVGVAWVARTLAGV